MNATDLQKLKEALELGHDAAHEVAQRFHNEYKGYRHAEHAQVDADVLELQRAIELCDSLLAKRAVSPAGKAGSIDGPKLQELLSDYLDAYGDAVPTKFFEKANAALIAYLDGEIAKARHEAWCVGVNIDALREENAELRQRAEGAELAVECEKDAFHALNEVCGQAQTRAREMEAKAAQYDAMVDEEIKNRDHYHDMADKLAQAIAEYFDADIGEHSNANCPWHEALRVIEEAEPFAARQAPDLDRLERWTPCIPDIGGNVDAGMRRDTDGEYWKIGDVQALLAQPLPAAVNLSAAFGEKAAQETVREFGQRMYEQGKADAAQPLQREDGENERTLFEAEIVKHFAFDPGLFKQFDGNTYFSDPLTFAHIGWMAARAITQPSDNLQQASTAQAEPVKTSHTETDSDIFDLIRAWAATPEGKRYDAARAITVSIDKTYSKGFQDGQAIGEMNANPVPGSWKAHGLVVAIEELIAHIGAHGEIDSRHALVAKVMDEMYKLDADATPAQATPEGGQWDGKTINIDPPFGDERKITVAWQEVIKGELNLCITVSEECEKHPIDGSGLPSLPPMRLTIADEPGRGHYYSADQMREYARAALAQKKEKYGC